MPRQTSDYPIGTRVRYIGGPDHTVAVGALCTVVASISNHYPVGLRLDDPDSIGRRFVVCANHEVEIVYVDAIPEECKTTLENYIKELTECRQM
jgi:hypothetical protein